MQDLAAASAAVYLSLFSCSFFFPVMLGFEPMVSHLLVKCSVTDVFFPPVSLLVIIAFSCTVLPIWDDILFFSSTVASEVKAYISHVCGVFI